MNLWVVMQDSAILQQSTTEAQNGESESNKGSYTRNFRHVSLNIPSEPSSLSFSHELTLRLGLCCEAT